MIRRPPRSTLFPYTNALPIFEERASESADVFRTACALLVLIEKRAAAEHGEQHDQDHDDARVHAVRRRTSAISRPASATRSGITAMFATLVQNASASASWRRFLRSSFSARL